MTLNGLENGVMVVVLRFFNEFGSLGPITSKWLKIDLYSPRRKCSPKNLVFSEISFMAIFAEVTENELIIYRHLRDIDPLLDYDASERQSYALGLIEIGLSSPYGFSVRT